MYVIKYHPRSPDVYKDRIALRLRNEIRGVSQLFGLIPSLSYKSRGGLPSPQNLGFLGGSFVKDPSIASSEAVEGLHSETILTKPINSEPYNVSIPNSAARDDPFLDVGAHHPFVGEVEE